VTVEEALRALETQPYERAKYSTYEHGKMCGMGCLLRAAGWVGVDDPHAGFLNIWRRDGVQVTFTLPHHVARNLGLPYEFCSLVMHYSDSHKLDGPAIAARLRREGWK
jgi:hypothetical protein